MVILIHGLLVFLRRPPMINYFAPMHPLIVTHQTDPGATFSISAAGEAHCAARAQRSSVTKRIRFIEAQQAQPLAVNVPHNLGLNTTSRVSVYLTIDLSDARMIVIYGRTARIGGPLHSRVHKALLVVYTFPNRRFIKHV